MSDSTKSMLSGIYEMGKSVREYIDQNGGGGSSGGSSSFGLIASKMDGINFTGELPDIIFQKDADDLEAALILQTNIDASTKIQYGANTAGTNRILRFDNSAAAGNMTNAGNWVLGSNDPGSVSVQHFIDAGKAAYLGGGSSGGGGGGSGGIGDSAEVINLSNFSGKIPDIIQFEASQGPVSYQFRYIQSNNLQFYDVGGNGERFRFNNDASGTFLDTNSSYSRYSGDTTLQSIIDNGHAIYLGGDSSSTISATPQFSRAQVSSSSRIGHSEADVDLDASQLATDSENWIHTNTTRNTVGILVPEDGLYDVSFNIRPVTNNNNNWRDNVSFLHTALQIVKADGTNVLVQETRESKNTGNGTTLNNHLYLDNLSLDQGDFLYLRCRVYSNNTSLSWAVDDNFSFLSISKPSGGSSSSGGGGTSSTNNIDSVVTKSENGPIDKRSTDTTASSTNFYRVPVESLRFNDLEVGATYRISVSARGHHGGGDLGAGLTVYNRANSFSTDINMDVTQLQTFNNNGGDSENPPRIITINSVGNDDAFYGEGLFQSKIFEATGTHLEVLAASVSLNSYLSSIEIQLEKITVGGNSSTGNGGIGSDPGVIAKSNFSELLPDRINVPIIRNSDTQERYFTFEGFFNRSAPNDMVQYEWNIGGGERFNITFKNNANGDWDAYTEQNDTSNTDVDFSKIPSAITNQPTLKEFIDANRAIYLGGGGGGAGGSGGLGINPYITGQSNFYSSLPDQIVLTNVAGTVNAAFSLYYVTSTSIFYHSPFIGTQPYIIFDNNASATFDEYRNTDASVFGAGQSLSGYISSGRAVYLGGGGSSTFEDLTDTPSTLTEGSGQYLKVSDDGQTIEYVDLPAGSVGGGSSSTISAVNQIQENIDNIPLIGSGVQIPDAILIKDINATTTNGADSLTQLDFASWVNVHDANGNITSQNFAYETNNFVSKRWYIRFNSIDGSYSSHSEDQHVKKEFNSIQEYISNDRALYFGGGGEGSSSSGGSLNSNDYIKSFSNFSGELPDAIIIRGAAPTEDQVVAGRLYYINGTGSTDQIFYDFLNWRVGFNNDPSGTNGSFYNRDSNTLHAGNSTWEFFDGATSLQEIIDNGDAIYLGGGGGYSTNNVVSAVIEADGTITSSSDDWIESVVVGNGFHTINFVSGYFTQAPSIATSIDHQDGVSHMNIEHQALTKDNVQIVHRGLGNASYTTRSQFTIMAQHQDRIARGGGGGGGGESSTSSEVHTIQGQWTTSTNTQPAFDSLTSGAQYLIGGTVGFGGDMSNLRVQLLSGTIGHNLNDSYSLAAAGGALYDFSHIASFSQIITATGSYHELQFESIGTVTSSVVADYQLYAKKA